MQIGDTYPRAPLGSLALDADRHDDLAGVTRDRDLAPDAFTVIAAV